MKLSLSALFNFKMFALIEFEDSAIEILEISKLESIPIGGIIKEGSSVSARWFKPGGKEKNIKQPFCNVLVSKRALL